MGYLKEDLKTIRIALEEKASDIAKEIDAKQGAPLDHEDICMIKDLMSALKSYDMFMEMEERAEMAYSDNRRYMDNRYMDGGRYGDDRANMRDSYGRDPYGRERDRNSRGQYR